MSDPVPSPADLDRPAFVYPLHVMGPGSVVESDPEWPPGVLDEVNARCDAFRAARAQAEVSSRDYLVD